MHLTLNVKPTNQDGLMFYVESEPIRTSDSEKIAGNRRFLLVYLQHRYVNVVMDMGAGNTTITLVLITKYFSSTLIVPLVLFCNLYSYYYLFILVFQFTCTVIETHRMAHKILAISGYSTTRQKCHNTETLLIVCWVKY